MNERREGERRKMNEREKKEKRKKRTLTKACYTQDKPSLPAIQYPVTHNPVSASSTSRFKGSGGSMSTRSPQSPPTQ